MVCIMKIDTVRMTSKRIDTGEIQEIIEIPFYGREGLIGERLIKLMFDCNIQVEVTRIKESW